MAVPELVRRLWLPTVLLTVGGTVAGFATDAIMNGGAPWWWAILVVGSVAAVAGLIWAAWAQHQAGAKDPSSGQSISSKGKNYHLSADRSSVAAVNITGGVNMNPPPPASEDRPDP